MFRKRLLTQVLALVLVLAFNTTEMLAASGAPTLPNPGIIGSIQQQAQIGQQAMAEVYKQFPVLPDSNPVSQYVQQLGQRLVSVIPPEYKFPYQFHVIPDKDINAFALPGGPIFVNVGTITAAQNEAQLAGVIAHEMSHVYMQHSMKQMQQASWAQGIAGVLGALVGRSGGVLGSLAQAGIQIGGGMVMMRYSRQDEAQADHVGAIIMYKAGYNPQQMAQFFKTLEQQSGSNPPQFLSDHPNPGNREQAINQEIANWPPENYRGTSQQFMLAKQDAQKVQTYTAQQIAEGAKTGEWAQMNSRNGSRPAGTPVSSTTGPAGAASATTAGGTLNNISLPQVRPNGSFQTLQNQLFTIKYPSNWQVMQDQQGAGVTIAPQAGMTQNAIAYGTIVNGFQSQQGQSTQQATQQLLAALQHDNPDLKPIGSAQPITVNGVRGQSLQLSGVSPLQLANGQPATERDWLVTLPRQDGSLLYLVFIAPEKDFSSLQPTFDQMLRSFHIQ
jgi:Zn-dependent protease with chaperone function